MSIPFRVGRYIDPSGFALAVVDVPELDPEKNISLIDYSHRWEENVSSSDRSVIKSYVDLGGHMDSLTVTDFVLTNIVTTATNDIVEAPLYYRHMCRFYNFTYGQSPGKQVYITDQNENILKDVNYLVKAKRISTNVYQIDVLTDFYSNEYTQYKVKYNRCTSTGSNVYPGWVENLNAEPYFIEGYPFSNTNEYDISGPDENGLWTVVVPPVPTLSAIINSVGVSFENCPTILEQDVTNNVTEYASGVTVRYTIKATGTTTFTIQRSHTIYGAVSNQYLQSATVDSWGASPVNLTIGTDITALYGTKLHVHGDNYLKTGDEAYFTAKKSYYYLMPTSYNAIYLKKPDHVTPTDDWYISVKDGRFRRRMNTSGEAVPSGQGTLYEYGVPEWDAQMWDLTYGPGYKGTLNERVELLDKNTVQLQRSPLFIDASSVFYNTENPGFIPSGCLTVMVNDTEIPATGVLDWDIYNGTVKLAQILSHRDDITVTYRYKEEFYEYTGYSASDTNLLCLFDASGVQDYYNAEIGGRATFYGDAELDPSYRYSGYASLKLDGTGDYVTIPHSTYWDFSSVDFSIETGIRFAVIGAGAPVIIAKCLTATSASWRLSYDETTSFIKFSWTVDGSTNKVALWSWTPVVDTWYHVALIRSGSTLKCFISGAGLTIDAGSDSIGTDVIFSNSKVLSIGVELNASDVPIAGTYFNGWIDDVKITKGRAIYTSDFSAPAQGDLPSTTKSVTAFYPLDLNPTPDHNYGLYSSGTLAHIYLKPYINVDLYTTIQENALYHNLTGTPESVYDFELGTISLGPHCKIEDIKITDVRTRGGGLSKLGISELDKVLEVQPEAEFFWDIGYFDGQAVPANGVLVVKIPKTVLTSNGGQFTEDEVRQKVLKHMALGEYPILEFV